MRDYKKLHRQEVDLNKDLLRQLDEKDILIEELKSQIEFFGEQVFTVKTVNALLEQQIKFKRYH